VASRNGSSAPKNLSNGDQPMALSSPHLTHILYQPLLAYTSEQDLQNDN
jgi:hypothetical protein